MRRPIMSALFVSLVATAIGWNGSVKAQSGKIDYSEVLKPRKERQFHRDWYAPYSLASPLTRNMIKDVQRLNSIIATVKRQYIQRSRQSTEKIKRALSTLTVNERFIMTFFSNSIYDVKRQPTEIQKVEYNTAKPYAQRKYLGEMRASMDHYSIEITPPLEFDNLICHVKRRKWGSLKSLPPFHKFFVENGLGIETIREFQDGSLPLCFVRYEGKMKHRNDITHLRDAAWFTVYSIDGLADISDVYNGDVWLLSGQVLRVSDGGLVTIRLKSRTVIGQEVIP